MRGGLDRLRTHPKRKEKTKQNTPLPLDLNIDPIDCIHRML